MHFPGNSYSLDEKLDTIIPRHRIKNDDVPIGGECGRTLLEPSGSFRSPINLDGSLVGIERCEWRIRATEGERIELYIMSLSTYESPDCAVDYLEIRNGYYANSTVLARYCGDTYPINLIASNYLLVTFVKTSEESIYSGFHADYKTICGGNIKIEKDAPFNLESTNFPDAYPPNRRCIWYFTAPDKHRIVMKINYFALETSDGCINDFLEIRDGNDNHADLIGLYCGIKNSWHVNSTDNKLSVVFVSNEIDEDYGFSATLLALPVNS
ncbi:dorsal-ventral patterning protein tolloid-like [Microplitis mediator]|uniref:dorsal-ventral patterning protein tolloid-like n=1 Tax=Microplitis mediator TaxID=375433 RepID=UPI002553DA03|nr:dorsal-ventral patterning protein tolloid-like [Microplitis mediator]